MPKTPKTLVAPQTDEIKDGATRLVIEQLITLMQDNHRNYYDDLTRDVAILPVNDVTPSVRDKRTFVTANTQATAITNLDDWGEGQLITIICGDVNTSISDGGNFKLSANWSPNADDVIQLICRIGIFYEVSRSGN